jgi:hypothetical protein
VHVVGGQFAQPPGADRGQDRGQDVLVLLDRFGRPAAKPLFQPLFGGAPDRVVRARPQACFEVAVQRFEPVLDDGFGPAGDLTPDPLAVRAEAEADRSPPAALAVPVPVAVAVGGVVLEEDSVLAPVPLEYSVGGLTWGFQLRSWRSAWDHRG